MAKALKSGPKRRYTSTGRWTKQRVIEAFQGWRDLHGAFPAYSDWTVTVLEADEDDTRLVAFRSFGAPTSVTVLARFGTWDKAVAAAESADRMKLAKGRSEKKQRVAPRAHVAASVKSVIEAEARGDAQALEAALGELSLAACEWIVRLQHR